MQVGTIYSRLYPTSKLRIHNYNIRTHVTRGTNERKWTKRKRFTKISRPHLSRLYSFEKTSPSAYGEGGRASDTHRDKIL